MTTNISQLAKYINNIQRGRPINLLRFKTMVDKLNLACEFNIHDVQARKDKGQLYIVTKIDAVLMRDLVCLVANGDESRAVAARQNRSHTQKVNGSFLIVREGENNPSVVIIDNQGDYSSNIQYSSKALIIENRQNFIDISSMFRFLSKYTDFVYEEGINVVFSEGNAIANSLHQSFLSQFSHIYLCLDFDLGGLKIANNLMNLLPDKSIDFLVPNDIVLRLKSVVELADQTVIQRIVELGMKNSKLAHYAKIMKDNNKTLEQEEYLND